MDRFALIFAVDALRYAIPASFAFSVVWIWKWDALAHRRIQPRRPSTKAFRREVLYAISTAAIFATVGLATFPLIQRGPIDSWAYWAFSIVAAIVIHDAYFYWTHRALHHPRLFRAHRVHHLSTNPSPWAAYAFAPLEALVNALIAPLLLLALPMHESALFVFLIYMIVMNVIGHLGHELYPPWWPRWYSTSTHHNLHHRDFHGNYGLYFTWWDRWMGTQHPDYEATFVAITSRKRA